MTGSSPVASTTVDSRPTGGGAAVEDHRHVVAEIGGDVRGGGRADVAGAVGARRGDGQIGGAQQGLGDRVRRDAHGDGVEAGGGEVGDDAVGAARRAPASAGRARRRRPALGEPRDSAMRRSGRCSGTCTISGLKLGRPLAA